jgi:DNA-binding MarR family transcriptional regulator
MSKVKIEKQVPAPSASSEPALSPQKVQGQERDTHEVADRLHSAAIHLLRRVRKQDSATGESPARLSALSVLVFGGTKTLGELAAAEGVRASTMSRMVAGLAWSGLIRITADTKDRRRMQIRATAKGRRMLVKGRERRVKSLAEQLSRLTGDELRRLGDGVEILRRLLAGWV